MTSLYSRGGKRAFDVAVAGSLLIVLSPVILAIAMTVWCADGRPIMFRQVRPGLDTRSFTLRKFRTMRDSRLEPDGARLTRVGAWLRSTSLDELPELFNVIAGDMSLVGPRPLLVAYLPRYTVAQGRRHSVRPGMTGWAQVHGRNSLGWDEKLILDAWYVEHLSLRVDVSILFRTIGTVLSRRGIIHEGGEDAHGTY
jgi:sugar transferase EpsL